MISLDTECTGVDLRHGSKPYFVTVCQEDGTQRFWQWDVDPLTREPIIPEGDVEDLLGRLSGEIVFHNAKFDVAALTTIAPRFKPNWNAVHDTLLAGHLLASNQPHNLTDMAIQYLGVDIEPFELAIKEATTQARRRVRQARLRLKRVREKVPTLFEGVAEDELAFEDRLGGWMIAEEGLEGMPSAKKGSQRDDDKPWKADMWLPRAYALEEDPPDDSHESWMTLLRDYANADSAATLALWPVLRAELERRKLWKIYEERRKLLPIIHGMESRGVTVKRSSLYLLREDFEESVASCTAVCTNIAAEHDYCLRLPKGAVNKNLTDFCFDVLKLEPVYNGKSKTGNPTLDSKNAMPFYLATLERGSKQRTFIEKLIELRSRGTGLQFLRSYEKFWVPLQLDDDFCRLFPSINPTGTDTLRCSCHNPNAQQISKREEQHLRDCFGPAPGREWWSLDAKNIELRLPAYLSGERAMIELFEREREPPFYGSQHILNFSVVYPDIWTDAVKKVGIDKAGAFCKKEYNDTWYQWVKNGDFAIQYNCGRNTADRAFHRASSFDLLKSQFASLEALNQRTIAFAERHGYIETIPDRSVDPDRGYPLLCTRTEYGKILPTVPLSYLIQGSAMWWTMRAMVRVQDQLDQWRVKEGFDGFITLQVHDELVIDFPRWGDPVEDERRSSNATNGHTKQGSWKGTGSNLGKIRIIQRLMEQGGKDFGDIPTPTGCEYHADNWGTGVTL